MHWNLQKASFILNPEVDGSWFCKIWRKNFKFMFKIQIGCLKKDGLFFYDGIDRSKSIPLKWTKHFLCQLNIKKINQFFLLKTHQKFVPKNRKSSLFLWRLPMAGVVNVSRWNFFYEYLREFLQQTKSMCYFWSTWIFQNKTWFGIGSWGIQWFFE